jgi:hypothetical protein
MALMKKIMIELACSSKPYQKVILNFDNLNRTVVVGIFGTTAPVFTRVSPTFVKQVIEKYILMPGSVTLPRAQCSVVIIME